MSPIECTVSNVHDQAVPVKRCGVAAWDVWRVDFKTRFTALFR